MKIFDFNFATYPRACARACVCVCTYIITAFSVITLKIFELESRNLVGLYFQMILIIDKVYSRMRRREIFFF